MLLEHSDSVNWFLVEEQRLEPDFIARFLASSYLAQKHQGF